ncbi:MAG: autotransporter beta- protein [Rhizorhabdus sp.]|nr:autotransporter beta- protein [Rhizorhabdus sp.]
MRYLLAATCLTPLSLIAAAAQAETTISTATTANIATSTAASGTADSITVSSTGSVKPASGTAVLVDSDHQVNNAGTIGFEDVDQAIGIGSAGGVMGTITNNGTISVTESTTAADSDSDGDNDGLLATGSGRYGIRIDGAAFTGDVNNYGTITIEGQDSAGIAVNAALIGALRQTGTISVIGDRSYGLKTAAVTGNIQIDGTISANGADAVGVAIDGDVTGAVAIQGSVVSSGYRSTAITDTTALAALDADDLLQGGPAVRIAASVSGGVLVDAPPSDTSTTDTDEDDDGVADASETTGTITSYGSAPALLIGSAGSDIALGAVASDSAGHGLVNRGTIAAYGTYNTVDATALQIGGLGGATTIAGGFGNSGMISAVTVHGNATALRIGSGAIVPELVNSGTISASSAYSETLSARAILIDAGAEVAALSNSGTITASTSSTAIEQAIIDRSGTLVAIGNSGDISGDTAIDLSANIGGATISQYKVATADTPTITGAILTGSGDDLIDIAAGTVTGALNLGPGDDSVALSGGAILTGTVDFGVGRNALTIAGGATFSGSLTGKNIALTVSNGRLDLGTGATALSSLSIGSAGTIAVTIDPTTGTGGSFTVAGTASFVAGAAIDLAVTSLVQADRSFTIVTAGSLSGADTLTLISKGLPYLYSTNLATDQDAGTISVDLRRKTAGELGLNRSRAAAYDAIYAALGNDAAMAGAIAAISDQGEFLSAYGRMIPIEAGGVFEAVTQGSRAFARTAADGDGPRVTWADNAFWLQQLAWHTKKAADDSEGYVARGWGFGGGYERRIGQLGDVGLSLAYLANEVTVTGNDNELFAGQIELAGYWRGAWRGWRAHARASASTLALHSTRIFTSSYDGDTIERTAKDTWSGTLVSANGGLSRDIRFGRLSLRPAAAVDYYRLGEKGHAETGGGDAFDLTVAARHSDELAATGTLTLAYDIGSHAQDAGWARIELEGGRRELIGGALAATVASFAGGDAFRLPAEERASGFVGRFRLSAGNEYFRVGSEVSAEQQQDRTAVALRASLTLGL